MSLLAALLFAVSFLPVRDAHFAVNDIPLAFICGVIGFFSLRFLEFPKPGWIFILGFLCGWAIGIKYNAAPILLSVFLVLYWVKDHLAFPKYFFLFLLMTMVGFCFAVPGSIFAANTFLTDFITLVHVTGDPSGYSEMVFVPTAILSTLMIGFGIIPSLLSLWGMIFLYKENKKPALVLLSFLAAYLLTLLLQRLYFSRFLLPVFPLLCVFAAAGLDQMRKLLPSSLPILLLLACLSVGESSLRTWKLVELIPKADTRVQALSFVENKTNAGLRILGDSLSLPYSHRGSKSEFSEQILLIDYNKFPANELKSYFASANVILVSEYVDSAVGLKKKESSVEGIPKRTQTGCWISFKKEFDRAII